MGQAKTGHCARARCAHATALERATWLATGVDCGAGHVAYQPELRVMMYLYLMCLSMTVYHVLSDILDQVEVIDTMVRIVQRVEDQSSFLANAMSCCVCPNHVVSAKPVMALKMDETDVRRKLEHQERYDPQTSQWTVVFHGDETDLPGSDQASAYKAALIAKYQQLMQIAKSTITGRGPHDCTSPAANALIDGGLQQTAQWLSDQRGRLDEKITSYQDKHNQLIEEKRKLLDRMRRARQASATADKLSKKITRLESLVGSMKLLVTNTIDVQRQVAQQHTLLAQSRTPAAQQQWHTTSKHIYAVLWQLVQDTFQHLRRAACKLLQVRICNCMSGDPSVCVGMFLIDSTTHAQALALLQRIALDVPALADNPAKFVGSDGGFTGLRYKLLGDPQTRVHIAHAANEKAHEFVADVKRRFIIKALYAKSHMATRVKAEMLLEFMKILTTTVVAADVKHVRVPAGTLYYPDTPWCARHDGATGDSDALAKLRIDPRLRDMQCPFFDSAHIDAAFPKQVSKSPLQQIEDYFEAEALRSTQARACELLQGLRPGEVFHASQIDRCARFILSTKDANVTAAVCESELAQAYFDVYVQAHPEFLRFLYSPLAESMIIFDDPPHIEKNISHGVQRGTRISAVLDDHFRAQPEPELVTPAVHGLDSGNLLEVALAYPINFGGVVRVINGDVDKQNVPCARLLLRYRLYIAALHKHGKSQEAIILQVLGQCLDALDSSHLTNAWRDFTFERARYLIHRMLGPIAFSVGTLAVTGGKTCCNMQITLLHRVLSDIDGIECFVRRNGSYPMYMQLNSDDLENSFSELTDLAGGYMPTGKRILEVAKNAERTARDRWTIPDTIFAQYDKRKRRTGVKKAGRLLDWNDGERVPDWFAIGPHVMSPPPDSTPGAHDAACTGRRKVKLETRMLKTGLRKASGTQTALREQHKKSEREFQ